MGKHGKKTQGGGSGTKLSRKEREEKRNEDAINKMVELQELEQRVSMLTREKKKIERRIIEFEGEQKRCCQVAVSLDDYNAETTTLYKSCGRAYLFAPKNVIEVGLEKRIKECDHLLPRLKVTNMQFENKLRAESKSVFELQRQFAKLGFNPSSFRSK